MRDGGSDSKAGIRAIDRVLEENQDFEFMDGIDMEQMTLE